MGFWDALGKFAGETMELADWDTTLREEGPGMLQVKIRNFLRRSSSEERRERGKKLRDLAYLTSNPDQRKRYATLYEVYSDEAARM